MANKKVKIEISEEEINQLVDEVENSNLSENARERLIDTLRALVELDRLVGLKGATIARLRKIFGKQTETTNKKQPEDKKEAVGTTGGNGRHGKDKYPGAKEILYPLEDLKEKDLCPECFKGKLYPWEPGIYVRITGNPPLEAVIHKAEKLRCNTCGEIFEASCPEKGKEKFDAQAKAVIALLHYKSSLPFYRIEKLQEKLNIPMPRSTLWAQVEKLANQLIVPWKTMSSLAAEGDLFYIDDTRAKVLSLMLENELNRENKKHRKGIYTTGVLSECEQHKVLLYFTGHNYSGENLATLIEKRQAEKVFAVMSDALNHNKVDEKKALKYLCLTHGRRNFIDLEEEFKEEAEYVLDLIGKVYKHDDICKENGLGAVERLNYHKMHSGPVMEELKIWLFGSFKDKKVEPNSKLGKGIKYIKNHWKGLTAFLRHPGAPLDNNVLEQNLRVPVLNRKNWLFFKNSMGAFVGDIILSIIKTCDINDENAFDYMVEIQNNFEHVKKCPEKWMPWNYRQNLKDIQV